MKKIWSILASLILLLVVALPGFTQTVGSAQLAVGQKYTGYAYPMAATSGNYLWAVPPRPTLMPSTTNGYAGNYTSAIIYWVTTGTPTCSLAVTSGPTAATATVAVNDPNTTINCGSTGQKVVSGLNSYFNIMPTFDSGTLTIYVTLFDDMGKGSVKTVATSPSQGNGAALNNSPWFVDNGDGTHNPPTGDAPARAVNVIPGTGSAKLFDSLADAGFLIPSNGVNKLFDTAPDFGYVRLTDGTHIAPTMDAPACAGFMELTDGTNTLKVASVANLTASTANGAMEVASGPRWIATNSPGAGNQASAVQGAGATGVQHVCDCVSFTGGATSAPSLTQLSVNLLDGNTVVASCLVFPGAAVGQNVKSPPICGLNIMGSTATAMTLQWSAGLANEYEAVTMTGYDVQ
jgi:hypothetical protein